MVKVYISHSIRGVKGTDATHEDMVENNHKAIVFGALLKLKFPHIDFYVPGDHDEWVLAAYEEGIVTEEQILLIDCQILQKRNILINYIHDQHISDGMLVENMFAQQNGIPIYLAKDVDAAVTILNRALEDLKG